MEESRSGDPCRDMTDVFAVLAKKRVYIETYGCSYNFGDTANLLEVLNHNGSIRVASPAEADVIIINTCTVVGPTERRMLRRLAALREKPLFVTGCMPLVQREAILSVCSPTIISPGQDTRCVSLCADCCSRWRGNCSDRAGLPRAMHVLHHAQGKGAAYKFPGRRDPGKSTGIRQLGSVRDPADRPGRQCVGA